MTTTLHPPAPGAGAGPSAGPGQRAGAAGPARPPTGRGWPRPTGTNPAGGLANPAVVALTLASVVGLARLFTNPLAFFEPVAVVGLAVHLAAWWCRRVRLRLLPAGAVAAAVGVVATLEVALPQTTTYGLPGRATLDAIAPALRAAGTTYRTAAAPTPVIVGFVLAGAFGVGAAAFLSDWAAFRMRTTIEACLPSFGLFVLGCTLAQGHGLVPASAVWLAALLCFLLMRQPATDGLASAWFSSRSPRRAGRILATGAVIGGLTVAMTAIVGPHLPGATTHPVVNWRHAGRQAQGRSTSSPLVDIKARLQNESTEEVFTVASSQPTYWRLTSLDTFDGSGWSLNDSYRRTGSTLALSSTDGLPADTGPHEALQDSFRVSGLQSLWLPAAYRPVQVVGVGGLSYSTDAASLITSRATSDGLSYRVTSQVPAPSLTALAQSPVIATSDPLYSAYLQLPSGLPGEVHQLALEHTAGATSPYDEALLLQNWLRGPSFRYDLNVPADDSSNALLDFLVRTRAGFCQQFAASFAVLARTLGLPTRVAVGFTEGQLEADDLYHVTNEDAHAWPEVYFAGIGWIAFEPTPGRGPPDPSAERITGVPPGQAAPPPGAAGATTPTTTATGGGSATTLPPKTQPVKLGNNTPTTKPAGHHGRSVLESILIAGLAALIALAVWVGGLAVLTSVLTLRRRRRHRTADARVALAWRSAEEALSAAGKGVRRGESATEFGRRASRSTTFSAAVSASIVSLAAIVELAAFARDGADDEEAKTAETAAASISTFLGRERDRGRRLLDLVDPRPAIRLARSEWTTGRAHGAATTRRPATS